MGIMEKLRSKPAEEDTTSPNNDGLDARQQELSAREKDLSDKLKDYHERLAALEAREADARNNFARLFDAKTEELNQREKTCRADEAAIVSRRSKLDAHEAELLRRTRELDDREAELTRRENSVKESERSRDEGYTKELAEHQQAMLAAAQEHEAQAATRAAAIISEAEAQTAKLRTEKLSALEEELADLRAKADEQRSVIDFEKRRLDARKKALDDMEADLESAIQSRTENLRNTLEAERTALKAEVASLQQELASSEKANAQYETLTRKLGGKSPEAVLQELRGMEDSLKQLRQDLMDRPPEQIRADLARLTQERDDFRARYESTQKAITDRQDELLQARENEAKLADLERENSNLQRAKESYEREVNRLQSDLERLTAPYAQAQNRDERIANITRPYFDEVKPRRDSQPIDEIAWLAEIARRSEEDGLKFPKRILYAFHTAMKTAEWSPLTVLAGVSGTGKSELPRRYAYYGGLNFLPLSVQPNWDSQESMLGFFNSIDNNFDAQPALRVLAQTQLDPAVDPKGLRDTMTIILLDEMNLAHVELYFAEFLSKLELRRGETNKHIPNIEVKLGAKVAPYLIPLGRNVLWVGTMNQDETTKTLSDKVLDRGIIINFPRPKKLVRRESLKPLNNPADLILRAEHWMKWRKTSSIFAETPAGTEQIAKYQAFIEAINDAMSFAGRALGHRVWQSIEYYMSNYPDVIAAKDDEDSLRKAMKVSFEDALVQKVMPKLYGIDTQEHSEKCLDEIGKLIGEGIDGEPFAIVEDYRRAMDFGYGQFMWNSAEYITAEND